jgi:L-seryl-tRNA(Ser) seleniumtransferase
VSGPGTIAIAKEHKLFTFNDAAADVPPVERLWKYPALGFDMVAFRGGKDIHGPQAAGILIGTQDLMHYALLNMSPQEDRVGRCCKIGKETIFGTLKALELFVTQEYDATLRTYDERAQVITCH